MSITEVQGQIIKVRKRRREDEVVRVELPYTDGDGNERVETFTCQPGLVPAAVAIDLVKIGMDSDVMWEFLETAFGADYPRLRSLLRSREAAVQADQLRDIIDGINEFTAARPTMPSSS